MRNEDLASLGRWRILGLAFIVALGLGTIVGSGGGEYEPSSAVAPVEIVYVVPEEVLAPPAPVVPMLLQGTYAPFEIAGYALTSLSVTTGTFTDLAALPCWGGVSYALNKKTGLVEIYCPNGTTYRLNTATLQLQPGAAIPKGTPFFTSAASAEDGTSFFGYGNYNFHWLPSNATLHVVRADGAAERTIPFPDYRDNRVPIKMKVVRTQAGVEKLIAVTQGYNWDDVAIHRFDVLTRRFEGACTLRATKVSVDIGQQFVVLTLRRGVSQNEQDALVIDSQTCATRASLRIPIDEMGIPIARFAVQTDEAIYLGGGSDRTPFAGPYGVWKFDAQTYQNTSHLPTTSYVFAGAYSKSMRRLWVATQGNMILEIDPSTMTKVGEFSKPLFGGDMFFVE